MTTSSIQISDIQTLKNPQLIADLFTTLGYTSSYAPLNTQYLELPPQQTQWLKQTYLIANQDTPSLQIILFEFEHPAEIQLTQIMHKIAQSLTQRPSNFLLLSTIKYDRLLLSKPKKTLNQKLELITNTSHSFIQIKNPSFNDINLLQKLAINHLPPTQIHQKQQEIISYEHQKQQQEKKESRKFFQYDSVRLYLNQIGKIPLLTKEKEIRLALKINDLLNLLQIQENLEQKLNRKPNQIEWATAANLTPTTLENQIKIGQKAKNELIEANLRLVVSIAKKYRNYGLEFLDIIQEGNLGLIRAAEKFDPHKGYKFSTYATCWIKQAITRAIADKSRIIRLPAHVYETISRIKKTTKILSKEKGRKPTEEEIATHMDMTIEKLRFITKSAQLPISLETPIGKEEDFRLGDLIEADEDTPEDYISQNLLREDLERVLDNVDNFSPRERDVLRLRYGLDDGRMKTLEEIGQIFGVTRERIRQIEAKSLRKLRHPDRNRLLKEYVR